MLWPARSGPGQSWCMMPKTSDSQSSSVASEWGAIVFALIFPTVLTWVYFIALADSEPWMQKGAYGIGKVIQFAFPLVFVLFARRERLTSRSCTRQFVPSVHRHDFTAHPSRLGGPVASL